jgi:predicted flap endonuclease-1-like 5' DNA nuclease
MGILEILKSFLGIDGRSETSGTTDPEVTVEREPSRESERAVKGAGPADAPRAPQSASASTDTGEVTAETGADESGPDADAAADDDAATADTADAAADDDAATADGLDAAADDDAATADTADAAADDDAATADGVDAAAETTDEPPDSPDVQAINGIGPTFAERLRATGIETVADLAAQDAATLAEAAETNEYRVEDWLEQARDW